MLRYREKEDFETRFRDVESAIERWRESNQKTNPTLVAQFEEMLVVGYIYHDAAIEGEVLSHSEIKAAIDTSIISDTSLIPSYEEIANFHKAFLMAQEMIVQGAKKRPLKVETLQELFLTASPESRATEPAYRKENPLHRLYYHDICPPEKIASKMKKLGEWLDDEDNKQLHPIERTAKFHWRFMAVFPWAQQSGRIARLACMIMLGQSGFPLPIIHSQDRQRYYEALRSANSKQLLSIYLEAVETTAQSALRVYEEAERAISKKRAS